MKKVKRLIEIKRMLGLLEAKIIRAAKKRETLQSERAQILESLSDVDLRLYKEKIERACK